MGKSFNSKGFYDDYDYEDSNSYRDRQKPNKNNDKKLEIQKARKKAQAERDKALNELMANNED